MGARLRGLAVLMVVLATGAFLGSALDQWLTRPPAEPLARRSAPPPVERVRVEVLNGGGRAGMARAATDRLRDLGFDVVYYGNADSFERDSSVVLDRVGRPDLARAVAEGARIPRIRSAADSNLLVDVSVVLGKDWEPEEVEPEMPAPAWWDFRRYFRDDRPGDEKPGPPGRVADPGDDEGGS